MADIEKAMKLAYGPEWRDECDYATANAAWEYAVFWLARGYDPNAALSRAVLALALCEPGTTKLGRWEVTVVGDPWLFESPTSMASRHAADWLGWVVRLAPGAYIDGSAQELLLLMAAADELRRRMEAEQ